VTRSDTAMVVAATSFENLRPAKRSITPANIGNIGMSTKKFFNIATV